MMRDGSRSFAGAARLFPPRMREAAVLLYAWCRHCDDQIDGEALGQRGAPGNDAARRQRLEWLRERTRRSLRGESMSDPVFIAFQRVVHEYAIPERLPLELLEGFAMDVDGRRYPDVDALRVYCYHVAGTVGLMMAHVMGIRDAWTLDRAQDLGIALQMTNIARDVLDDAWTGRVYLPLCWLEEAGVPAGEVAEPRNRPRVAAVVARLLAEADRYYASGDRGIGRLPLRCAWAVAVARDVYSAIGWRVRRLGPAAWDQRTVVPRWRKLAGLGIGLLLACRSQVRARLEAAVPRPELAE
jgi:phytoene synthase